MEYGCIRNRGTQVAEHTRHSGGVFRAPIGWDAVTAAFLYVAVISMG